MNLKNARNCYHVARLTLFNVRLLSSIQNSEDVSVKNLISSEIIKNGIAPPLSTLHQGTFLSVAYICFVYLWESAKRLQVENELLNRYSDVAKSFGVIFPKKEGEREIKTWPDVIRLIRNALGHGRVEVMDGYFILSDINRRKKEKRPTSIKLTWEDLGKLSEVCIHSLTPFLYPEKPKSSLTIDKI